MNTETPNDPAREAFVDARLADLRRESALLAPPAALEGALLAKFRREQRPARRPLLWWMPPLALAATIALVSWMIRGPLPPMKTQVQAAQSIPASATPSDDAPFLALRPLERIALEPGTTVVATEFPRALLADWGLPVSPDRAGEPVRAEMLYSADGEALAVRLIN
ncbi:MAG TPA: hypothetical protein VEC19_06200 [Usitatibacter sp.]|nr:hypothetical protein [Usitatibacter sp.]